MKIIVNYDNDMAIQECSQVHGFDVTDITALAQLLNNKTAACDQTQQLHKKLSLIRHASSHKAQDKPILRLDSKMEIKKKHVSSHMILQPEKISAGSKKMKNAVIKALEICEHIIQAISSTAAQCNAEKSIECKTAGINTLGIRHEMIEQCHASQNSSVTMNNPGIEAGESSSNQYQIYGTYTKKILLKYEKGGASLDMKAQEMPCIYYTKCKKHHPLYNESGNESECVSRM